MSKLILLAICLGISSVLYAGENKEGLTSLPSFDQPWTSSDLSALKPIIGSSTYVGLGENVHATEGFSQAKLRIIKFMVEEMGFRAFAMETPWFRSQITVQYVATCNGTSKDALKGIFGVWYGQSTADLLQWLCEFNQKHPQDPIKFFGFDIQNPPAPIIGDLEKRLSNLSPEKSTKLINGIKSCIGYGLTDQQFYETYGKGEGGAKVTEQNHRGCLLGLKKIDQNLSAMSGENRDVAWARIDIKGLVSFQNELFYTGKDYKKMFESRDDGMAFVLDALHKLLTPNLKTIVWAHNTHLALNHAVVKTDAWGGMDTMGHFLQKTHGEDYTPIALTGYKVDVHWPGHDIEPLPQPDPNSVEGLIYKRGYENAILDLKGNFLAEGESYLMSFDSMIPKEQYRGIVYLKYCAPMVAPR